MNKTSIYRIIKNQTEGSCTWVMRQAGRYLPEYRELRKQQPDFIKFCLDINLITEATLQPITRFNFDAAIIFSDILIVPYALGINVTFVEGEGPVVEKISSKSVNKIIEKEFNIHTVENVYKGIAAVRKKLPEEKSLIGFCGSPWTLLAYMFDGHPSKDAPKLRAFVYQHPELFKKVVDKLADDCATHLTHQIKNGADTVMIFGSWEGLAPADIFKNVLLPAYQRIIEKVKYSHASTSVIFFPRGVKNEVLEMAAHNLNGLDVLAIDQFTNLGWAFKTFGEKVALMGNLDPAVLLTTPEIVKMEAEKMLQQVPPGARYISNLGHGVLPPTPVENMEMFVKTLRKGKQA